MTRVELIALPGVPEVTPGADLTTLVVEGCERAGFALRDRDVVCIAQKAVSKAEGALIELPPGVDVATARRELARREALRVVAETANVLVVETRHGFVCANAGVDASNLPQGIVSLLPPDPDASAQRIAAGLRLATGKAVGVVISDTFGRPWRMGQTDVALGVAGIAALRDERGGRDRFGRPLEVTVVAVADELAAAADIVRRKADGVPFVIIRGGEILPDPHGSARPLVRPAADDLFRWGLPQAVLEGLSAVDEPKSFGPGPVAVESLNAALCTVGEDPDKTRILRVPATASHAVIATLDGGEPLASAPAMVLICLVDAPKAGSERDARVLAAGGAAARLRVAVAALGYSSAWRPIGTASADVSAFLDLEPEDEPFGVVGVGRPHSA